MQRPQSTRRKPTPSAAISPAAPAPVTIRKTLRPGEAPIGASEKVAPNDTPTPASRASTGLASWRIDPDAFRNELALVYKRYKLPIYVTENGYGAHETLDKSGGVNDPTSPRRQARSPRASRRR